jgi:hypothetical protein
VQNHGLPGKGLTAEDLSIAVTLPSGSTVAEASGPGYQGVRRDAGANADVMVWQVRRMTPKDKQIYTFTLSGSATRPAGGTVRRLKPALKDGANDQVNIACPLLSNRNRFAG